MPTVTYRVEYDGCDDCSGFETGYSLYYQGKISPQEFEEAMEEINKEFRGKKSITMSQLVITIILLVSVFVTIMAFVRWYNTILGIVFAVITGLSMVFYFINSIGWKNRLYTAMNRVIDAQNEKYFSRGIRWEFVATEIHNTPTFDLFTSSRHHRPHKYMHYELYVHANPLPSNYMPPPNPANTYGNYLANKSENQPLINPKSYISYA